MPVAEKQPDDAVEEIAFASIEEERLQRIGIAVLSALVTHVGLFLGIAIASWNAPTVKAPPSQDVTLLKNDTPEEVNREPPVAVEPPRDAMPDDSDMTVPDEDKSSIDPGARVFDPNMDVGDHVETDDDAEGHGAKGDPNADMANLAMAIDNFSKGAGITSVHGSGTGHGTGERYGHRGPGGQRNLTLKGGGNRSTQDAVRMCLTWLAKHQSADGRWDADGFDANCTKGRCEGKGTDDYDLGLTGLAIVAFTGHGDTHKTEGPFRETVEKGLKFILREQKSSGVIGDEKVDEQMYNHAIATYAIGDAYVLTHDPMLKEPLEKAVKYLLAAQNPGKAWRYHNYNAGRAAPEGGINDTSVTGWVVMALHAAEEGDIPIPPEAYAGANAWLDEAASEKNYGVMYGYDGKGKFVFNKPFVTTAAGALVRQFTGNMKGVDGAATVLASHLPEYGEDKANFYEWYYSTLVLFQYGGEPWTKWNEALKKSVCQNLRYKETDSCVWGSMDPVDYWGKNSGGRVYSTACAALCMEVYYRYVRLSEKK